MTLVLVRIDDRLVHGQVLEGWVPAVDANHLVVLRPSVLSPRHTPSQGQGAKEAPVARDAEEALQHAIFSLASPPNLKISFLSAEEAAQRFNHQGFGEDRVFLLAPSPLEILALLQMGTCFSSVNLGGLHYAFGRMDLGKPVTLDPEDKNALLEIARRGVKLESRAAPGDEPIDIIALIKEG